MNALRSAKVQYLVFAGAMGLMAVIIGARLLEYESNPWAWVAVFALGVFVLAGPCTWVVRDRLSADRRDSLTGVATIVGFVCLSLVVAVLLLTGDLLFYLDTLAFGAIVGYALAVLGEQTVLPERLRRVGQ